MAACPAAGHLCRGAVVHLCKRAAVQLCKRAAVQACKRASVQLCRRSERPVSCTLSVGAVSAKRLRRRHCALPVRSPSVPAANMMYFEDYMEMIEGLPQEVMEKLTQIRQLDLAVDNMLQPLGASIAELFGRCAAGAADADWRLREHRAICQQFAVAQGHSDEKLALAKHLLDTVARLKRRLDSELEKFKLELEADNAGFTSSIEEKVLGDGADAGQPVANGHAEAAADAPLLPAAPASPTSVLSANQHRRHSPPSSVASSGDTPRRGLKRSRSSFLGLEALGIADLDAADSLAAFFDDSAAVEAQRQAAAADDEAGDDNRRYCICQDVSHGEMIACEAADCPYEWFHFSCVGLTVAPRGAWFCPSCRSQKRHRLK